MARRSIQMREPRARLSRELVLQAAIGLADEAGIEALSMRRLGQALRVEAMSLYNHVANKEDLLEGIVDIVLSQIELAPPSADWKVSIRAMAISAHDVLVRHPWAANLMLRTSAAGRLRYMEAILGGLREGGFSAEMTDHAYHALDSHIAGFTLWQVSFDIDAETLPDLASRFLDTLGAGEHPWIVEHVHQHLKDRNTESGAEFAFGLDLILDGLERIRERPA